MICAFPALRQYLHREILLKLKMKWWTVVSGALKYGVSLDPSNWPSNLHIDMVIVAAVAVCPFTGKTVGAVVVPSVCQKFVLLNLNTFILILFTEPPKHCRSLDIVS